jgi:hypothetical protein
MYLRLASQAFVGEVVAPTIRKVTGMVPVEINPLKQPGFDDDRIQTSGSVLESLSQELLDRLATYSEEEFPLGFRTITSIIYAEVEAKFPRFGQDVLVTTVFLRMLCPAIVSPWMFGLTDTAPHPLHARYANCFVQVHDLVWLKVGVLSRILRLLLQWSWHTCMPLTRLSLTVASF